MDVPEKRYMRISLVIASSAKRTLRSIRIIAVTSPRDVRQDYGIDVFLSRQSTCRSRRGIARIFFLINYEENYHAIY